MENEKMYRDVDEVESIGAEALVPTGRLWALLEHLGITTAHRYRIKEVSCPWPVELKVITGIFLGSRVLCGHKGLAFRIPSYPSQEEGSIQGLWGEEGCPQDGDGAPPGCDGGAEHPFTGRPARD
jgi:hypothetical protein